MDEDIKRKSRSDSPPRRPSIFTTQTRHYDFTLQTVAKMAFLGSLELVKEMVMLENGHLELSSDYTMNTLCSLLNKS